MELKPEILAPAGNLQSLKAAMGSGADAVYLGLDKYNARANAENFNIERIDKIFDYAHLFGVKVYIAMNTLLKDCELNEAVDLAAEVWDKGADAIIIQDLGLCERLKKIKPDIVLHASTQMGIHNYAGAKAAEKLGFKRVILSRETTLEDIRLIKKNTDIELEYFIHGALCVAFSGNCYLSSLASGYSGNRGRCMQLCRKKYFLKVDNNKKEGYYLSAKDIMLVDRLKELIEAGICSFKIEGRLRRAEYVATVVKTYKKALIDDITDSDRELLKLAFNRGEFCEAHLYNPTSDIIFPDVQNHIGINHGFVQRKKGNILTLSKFLRAGDGIKFLHNGKETGSASIKSDGNITGYTGNVQVGDEVRLTSSVNLSKLIEEPRISIKAKIRAYIGQALSILFFTDNEEYEEHSDFIIEKSLTSPMNLSDISNQIRVKDTEFELEEIEIKGDDNLFIPKSVINSTRRNALNKLKNKILQHYNRQSNSSDYKLISEIIRENHNVMLEEGDIIQIDLPEKMELIPENYKGYISINPERYNEEYLKKFKSDKYRCLLSLPNIIRYNDLKVIERLTDMDFYGFIINNLGGLELVKDKRILFGWQMNLINSEINELKILSPEADQEIDNAINYTFGYVPLMTFTHCPKKSLGRNCKDCRQDYEAVITDEKNHNFPIRHFKIYYCYAQMLNYLPIYQLSKKHKFIDLTNVEMKTCKEIWPSLTENKKINNITTKGNWKRGLK